DVYRDPRFRDELRPELRDGDLVQLPDLHEARSAAESIELNDPRSPCLVISASGMATGGRVLHHLRHLQHDRRHSVVLTGYQAVGTRGRDLAEGARLIKMHGRYVPVRAEVVLVEEFSVHADADELLGWVGALRPVPETVFVNHGEPEAAAALAARIDSELGIVAVAPRHGEVVSVRPGTL